ncbi:MAG TPA: hypothetical protein VLA56_03355 [Pseudomonadales bacterium]|nr:hypothetical protein [Pseudomonadales bacterium]
MSLARLPPVTPVVSFLSPAAQGLPLTGMRRAHPLWFANACAYLLLCAVLIVPLVLDERLLGGVSVWKKPFKFALSLGVLFATLAWCAGLLPRAWWRSATGRVLTWIAVPTAAFEMAYILIMAALGQPSHFNVGTPLTATLYSLMGIGAALLVSTCLGLAVAIAAHDDRWTRDPLRLAVVLGLGTSFFLGGGFGAYLGSHMSHWVAASPTDAGGLPIFDWARDGGDLRVAHFFGMHAMQALPVVGLLATGRAFGRSLVLASTLAWAALCIATFTQALRGVPFL